MFKRMSAVLAAAAVLFTSACGVDTANTGGSAGSGGSITVTAFAGAWSDAFRSSFVEPFEKDTGIKVNLVLGADADWLTKLRAANGKNPPFDVVAFTSESVRAAVGGNLLQPLDTAKISTWPQLSSTLVQQSVVNGKSYGAPLTTGSLGWLYRTDKIANPPKDWQDIFDPAYCGHIALPPLTYNPGMQFFSALVHSLGGQLSNPSDVDRAFTELQKLKGCVSSFPADAGSVATAVQNGDAWIVPFWDGRALAMEKAGQPIGFTYPASGAVGALTSYYVATGTTHTDEVYKFLNYLTAAQYQKPFAEATFYGAGNDTIAYSADFDAKIKHGEDVYKTFTWVDYAAATPNLNSWQQRWNQIFG
ncbi:putative spermidine/putrescine transport system substrate-binding protein [Amycolatopsis bartoniae]|uniref:ABC transporter substrate-binding protein n=1 Tax=Amycolatopsis bartoniae TaxID=941986 RepID=A0A8H9IS52_9PSEU|nr:extracellular solute-binding protein [Amycolatopsis bartoniae]MBB2937208.1 putative spermidine/putrescine transport system substrate-binding protein [Amycolatopsis bartoniae]TVT09507.1 extracellular solute-binding protein [Amycolatopsis bartoniae]GHF53270.1 ABC transporter substrate-binding protein [Amycolatopsis bartoniae]